MGLPKLRVKEPWRSSALLYAALAVPLALLLLECGRGAYCDVELIRAAALQQEMGHLRASATRRATVLETQIPLHGGFDAWDKIQRQPWLTTYWDAVSLPEHQQYAAIVDANGRIVLHTNRSSQGKELGPIWYQQSIPEAGMDVVRVQHTALVGDEGAYDVRIPLLVNNRQIGEFHQGLNAAWFDNQVASQQREVVVKWIRLFAVALIADGCALLALVVLARRQNLLQTMVRHGPRNWAARLGQIAAGLAHEIRNPLHALRINLHTLKRSISGPVALEPDEMEMTIVGSNRAIDALDRLMRDLLQFTTTDGSTKGKMEVNIVGECQATLNLMSEEMRRKQIVVHTHLPRDAIGVAIDPARLRQILADLLTYGQNNAGAGGSIDVVVSRNGTMACLEMADSGPSLTDDKRTRLFEPFQATRETTSGLGLALVKHFSDEAGGSASYVRGVDGCRFRILLPLFPAEPKD